jgi:hypothetical protein
MKAYITLIIAALVLPTKEYAQTRVDKSIPVQSGQKVVMHFDYPDLIKVTTWDRNEVSIQGTVSINNGESDDHFELETSSEGNTVFVNSRIRDIKGIPQRVTIFRDGQKIMFKDKAELKKYQDEHGKGYNTMSWGADFDIELEIKVPKNVDTRVESVYGMVEVKNFAGPLRVEATYGGVDAALAEKSTGEIVAETNYGEIFTNLDAKFGGDGRQQKDFHTSVTAKPGTGPRYTFESKYGNVYLRKATN